MRHAYRAEAAGSGYERAKGTRTDAIEVGNFSADRMEKSRRVARRSFNFNMSR
jgi:hypothetical protein